MKVEKTIVIADPFSSGHHLAFMRLFCQAYLELGFEVWALWGGEEKALFSWVVEKRPEASNRFKVESFPASLNSRTSSFGNVIYALTEWCRLSTAVKSAERKCQRTVDVVFFAWLDSYLANYLSGRLIDLVFRYKWTGLYFHPRHMRFYKRENLIQLGISSVDSVLSARKCISLAVHDPAIIDNYRLRLKGKKVVFLPEVADITEPDANNSLAAQIKEMSGNRLVVGLVGLSPHQGLALFCDTVYEANDEDFFFVLAGQMPSDLAIREKEMLLQIRDSGKSNCLCHFDYLKEGGEYNAVVDSLDVIWLVYNDFASTSNRLTKAAHFKKLSLAKKGYIVAELVDQYKIGKVIDALSAIEVLTALYDLKCSKPNNMHSDFQGYLDVNNYEYLRQQLKQLIGHDFKI